jgi:hypothetical protein
MNTYGWGYAIGQLASAIALNVVNTVSYNYSRHVFLLRPQTDPSNYLKAIYSEWVPLGMYAILVVFLPESPRFYARGNQDAKARKTLTRMYGKIDRYDVDREYAVMLMEIQQERRNAELNAQSSWRDLFTGTNTVGC